MGAWAAIFVTSRKWPSHTDFHRTVSPRPHAHGRDGHEPVDLDAVYPSPPRARARRINDKLHRECRPLAPTRTGETPPWTPTATPSPPRARARHLPGLPESVRRPLAPTRTGETSVARFVATHETPRPHAHGRDDEGRGGNVSPRPSPPRARARRAVQLVPRFDHPLAPTRTGETETVRPCSSTRTPRPYAHGRDPGNRRKNMGVLTQRIRRQRGRRRARGAPERTPRRFPSPPLYISNRARTASSSTDGRTTAIYPVV